MDHRAHELESNESWLRSVLKDTGSMDVDAVQQAVSVAVDECWLAQHLHVVPPAGLHKKIRTRMDETLEEMASLRAQTARRASSGFLRWARVGRWGFASAAAVILFVLLYLKGSRIRHGELVEVTAYEAFKCESLDDALAALEADLSDFEFSIAESSRLQRSEDEWNDIMERIDGLWWEDEFQWGA